MNQKETWIAEMENTEFVHRVEPNAELINRLKGIPQQLSKKLNWIPKRMVWTAAASIALLIGVNAWTYYGYKNSTERTAEQTVEESYFSHLEQL